MWPTRKIRPMSSHGLADQECPRRSRARSLHLVASVTIQNVCRTARFSSMMWCTRPLPLMSSFFCLPPSLSLAFSFSVSVSKCLPVCLSDCLSRSLFFCLLRSATRSTRCPTRPCGGSRSRSPTDSSYQGHVGVAFAIFESAKVSVGGEREAAPDHERHEAAGNKNRPASPLKAS